MKSTTVKISISQDGLLPQQSIELGRTLLQSFPKKLMNALDFEKVDGDRKNTTFIGIVPVFVVIGEKTQEIEIELTVAHPELRDKVVDIFTSKQPIIASAEKKQPVSGESSVPKKAANSKTSGNDIKKTPAPASKAKPVSKLRKISSAETKKKVSKGAKKR